MISIHKPSSNNEINLIILQVNMNGINNKLQELRTLIKNTHADVIKIQETKLTSNLNTPKVPTYTTYCSGQQATQVKGWAYHAHQKQHNINSNRDSFDHKYT